jgi:hypothetical protein
MQADRLPSHRGQHVDASRDYVVREANVAARRQFVGPLPLAGSPGQNRLGIADKAPVVAAAQQVRRTGPMGRRGKLRLVAPITSGETERRSLGSQVPGGAPIARFGKVFAELERGAYGKLALFGAPGVPPDWHGDVVHAWAVALALNHYRCIRLHRAGCLEQMGQPRHFRPACPLQSGRSAGQNVRVRQAHGWRARARWGRAAGSWP